LIINIYLKGLLNSEFINENIAEEFQTITNNNKETFNNDLNNNINAKKLSSNLSKKILNLQNFNNKKNLGSQNNLSLSNNSFNKNSNDNSYNNKDNIEIKSTDKNKYYSKNSNMSSYNMTEFLQKIQNEKNNSEKKLENNSFINSSSIINFQYEKFVFELSFIKKNCNEILNTFKEKKINKKIFLEKITKIKEISDLNSLEEIEENFLKKIFSLILIKYRIHLNREITKITHCNIKSFSYFGNKYVTKGKEKMNDFSKKIDYFPILEIESIKYDREQKTFEDGILHVVFLLFKDQKNLIDVFSRIKYEVYYSENALCNYLCKYVYELVYEYSNISYSFLDFFKNFGFLEKDNDSLQNKEKDKKLEKKKSQEENSCENFLTFDPYKFSNLNNDNFKQDKNKNKDIVKDNIRNSNPKDVNKNKQQNIIGFIVKNNNCNENPNNNNSFYYSENNSNLNVNSSYITSVAHISDEEESLRKKENSINFALDEDICQFSTLKKYKKTADRKNSNMDIIKKSKRLEKRIDINYPFKKISENLQDLINLKIIKYLLKNISYMKGNNDLDSIPFYKFIKLFMKFNTYFLNEDGLKMKHSFLRKAEYENFTIFQQFLIFDDSDKISKDHKVDLDKIIYFILNYFEKEFKGFKPIEDKINSKINSNTKIINIKNDKNNIKILNNDTEIDLTKKDSLVNNEIDNKNLIFINRKNEGKNN
jgi:hypothetical protein